MTPIPLLKGAVPRALTPALTVLVLLSACSDRTEAPEASEAEPERSQAAAAPVSAARIESGDAASWLSHGRTYDEQRFSPLDDINTQTIGELSLAWYYDLDTNRGQEASPLVIDGVIYSTSAWSKVQAVDARTGELKWQYDPEVPGAAAGVACCDVVNRGVAAWGDNVYVGTIDGRLIAIDRETGARVWETVTAEWQDFYTITGAPRVVKGNVLIGNGGAEYGVRGYVSAYDAETGEMVWRFYTVPGNPAEPFENPILEMAAETWNGEWWKLGGGGTAWDSMAYDPELDLLYIGVGNGSPWNPDLRSPGGGDNLFLSSIVALRPDTGEYVWHYQTSPGDQWDYTATQHIILADMEIGGDMRQVLMQAPKNGFFYVIDRATGQLISAEPYVPVNWADGVNLETGRPNIVDAALYHKTGEPFVATPGFLGGHNWHPMSYNPQTGLVYLPAQEIGAPLIPDTAFKASGMAVNLGIDLGAAGLPADQKVRDEIRRSLKGRLLAWDPVAQEAAWSVEYEGPWNGGTLSTAGGLVFQGTRVGELVGFDATSGEKLWAFNAQTGIVAPPISYELDGEQYLTVVAGWGGVFPLLLGELSRTEEGQVSNRSRILTFKLGGTAELPDAPTVTEAVIPEGGREVDTDVAAAGSPLYARYCAACHGDTAVSGGILPDLRLSAISLNADIWRSIVHAGAYEARGMPKYSAELSEEQVESIRQYVNLRENESNPGD